MRKKEVKTCRFNYVMTEKERESLKYLFEHHKKTHGRVATIGSIVRKLIADEVERIKESS